MPSTEEKLEGAFQKIRKVLQEDRRELEELDAQFERLKAGYTEQRAELDEFHAQEAKRAETALRILEQGEPEEQEIVEHGLHVQRLEHNLAAAESTIEAQDKVMGELEERVRAQVMHALAKGDELERLVGENARDGVIALVGRIFKEHVQL